MTDCFVDGCVHDTRGQCIGCANVVALECTSCAKPITAMFDDNELCDGCNARMRAEAVRWSEAFCVSVAVGLAELADRPGWAD